MLSKNTCFTQIHFENYPKILFFGLSFLIIAFGQPAFSIILGIIASSFGFALFWGSIISINSRLKKFFIGSFWFFLIQLVQLFWLISHPYYYIYGLYLFLALAMGLQFGIICLFINRETLKSLPKMAGVAGLWTILEWSRLYFLSGFSFNPVGLSLTGTLYGLQGASLLGVFGLSFWVIFVNLLALSFYYSRQIKKALFFICMAFFPYFFGFLHFHFHSSKFANEPNHSIKALLVQTAFPIEENLAFDSFGEAVSYVEDEWIKILEVLQGKPKNVFDLIVLPEYVVPFGTYKPLYKYETVKAIFKSYFGEDALAALPPLIEPYASQLSFNLGEKEWLVTNAFFSQFIANIFQSDLIVGLQDDEPISEQERRSYSSAFYFKPNAKQGLRYEKRVLLPMAEYIPFSFCKEIAKRYGICSSFTCGTEAKVFSGKKVPFGLSICYEETFGNLMRESRQKGAEMLINITSDVWYPNSSLPKQHFDHARLRTVENGIPLLRSCNTGITAACDSLGRTVAMLGDGSNRFEWVRDALSVEVPAYHYQTLYSKFGDGLIIGISFITVLFLFYRRP